VASEGEIRKSLVQVIPVRRELELQVLPPGTEIVVSSRREDAVAHMRVRDHGMGIAPEALEQIFIPYNRVSASKSRYVEGASLGLPLVRQMVELHGGHAWAECAQDRGTVLHSLWLSHLSRRHSEVRGCIL
jgi:signal transduction histidine kinase